MRYFSKKNIFQIIKHLLFIITQITCLDKEEKSDDKDQPDKNKILGQLQAELQEINTEIAKFNTIIYILIPTAIILFLIIIGFSIYEIIKCIRKKKIDLIEDNKYLNPIMDSFSESSTKKRCQNNEIKDSFHSSKMSDSMNSNNLKQSDFINSFNENINIKVSSDSNDRSLSGCEAPLVNDLENKENNNNNQDKHLTNKGDNNENENKNVKYIPNPFLK